MFPFQPLYSNRALKTVCGGGNDLLTFLGWRDCVRRPSGGAISDTAMAKVSAVCAFQAASKLTAAPPTAAPPNVAPPSASASPQARQGSGRTPHPLKRGMSRRNSNLLPPLAGAMMTLLEATAPGGPQPGLGYAGCDQRLRCRPVLV